MKNKIKNIKTSSRGQALVTLLFFIVIAITILSGAAIIAITSSQAAGRSEQGSLAYYIAESGVENALLRLLRDPSYTGETLAVGDGEVEISVSGSPPVILSTGKLAFSVKKIQAQTVYSDDILTISSWKEIF